MKRDIGGTARPSCHIDDYEKDFARQVGSGIHTFTPEHRTKNRAVMSALQASMPFQDVNKTNDCDLIYRYLIARKWDVEAATQSIRDYLEWRRRERIDEVMWEAVDPQVQQMIATFFGMDKEGYPVLWDAPNPKLVTQLLKSTPRDTMLRAHYKMMESARYLSRTNGVDRITYVLDLTAVTMSSVNTESIGILKEMSKMDQLYFPEIMRRMLICNGGWVVTAAWKIIRPLLDERVQKKIQFLKEAPSAGTLSEYIADSHVHPNYGGKGLGLSGKLGTSLVDQLTEASVRRSTSSDVSPAVSPVSQSPATYVAVQRRSSYDEEQYDAPECSTSDDEEDGVRPPPPPLFDPDADVGYYSLSDDDDDFDDTRTSKHDRGVSPPVAPMTTIGARKALSLSQQSTEARRNGIKSPEPARAIEADRHYESTSDLSVTTVCGNSSPHPDPATLQGVSGKVLTPGRLGDGTAVEIEIHRHGKVVRGFHQSRLVGESQDNLIVSFTQDAIVNAVVPGVLNERLRMPSPSLQGTGRGGSLSQSGVGGSAGGSRSTGDNQRSLSPSSSSASVPSPLPSPSLSGSTAQGSCRVLIGELLRESGHPIHTHLVVSDANRNAKFVLMQRNFHKQIVIYQVVGDTKIHTSKTCKHSVLGEKAKMARCGERVEGCDARDWAVWGKVRVGNQEVRKYLAEKQGWSLLFYDTLASLPIQDLFCLAVGLMELWEE